MISAGYCSPVCTIADAVSEGGRDLDVWEEWYTWSEKAFDRK